MKRDVLFMCQFFYPEFVSSALLPYQTAKGLADEGIMVDVLCGYPKEYSKLENKVKKKEKINNINIYRKKYLQLGRKNPISRLINYFSFTFSMLMNLPNLRKYKIVIVYSNPPILPIVTVLAKKLFGIKIVFVSYDIYPEIAINTESIGEKSIISKTMNVINNSVFNNVSSVVSLSFDMKNFIINNREICPGSIEVIPNWATETYNNVKTYSNKKLREISSEFKLIVGYFGNMGTAQDIDTLMEVMNRSDIKNSNIAFLFAGHGNKKETLKKFIFDNQINNCFIFDFLTGDDFSEALSISDLFVVSLADNLSGLAVPSKTYSYYQAGKPVIAIMSDKTDIVKEIKSYQAGFAFDNGASEELAEVLINLQKDGTDRLQAMSSSATQLYIDKYQKNYQIKKYVDLINSLLEEEKC